MTPGLRASDGQWNSGRIYDTMFATWYPPNVGIGGGTSGSAAQIISGGFYPDTASSQHPGGLNVALCDGSVRFIKNAVSSWSFDPTTNMPLGVSLASFVYTVALAPTSASGSSSRPGTAARSSAPTRTEAAASRICPGENAAGERPLGLLTRLGANSTGNSAMKRPFHLIALLVAAVAGRLWSAVDLAAATPAARRNSLFFT